MPGMQRNWFQRAFVQDIGLKVVSLLLAIGLWMYLGRDSIAEVEVRVPIRVPESSR